MSDELSEALARHDSHEPIDPDTLDVYVEAARRWASFPTDEDVEAVINALDLDGWRTAMGRVAMRAALEAVIRGSDR